MPRKLRSIVSALALLLGIGYIAYTQQNQAPPPLAIQKVKDDLYVIEGSGGNVAVYVTGEGVILVDDKFDRNHDEIVERIKSVTSQSVKYIFTTHYHEDHSGGNAKFLPNTQIISTLNSRLNILGHKQPNASPGVMPATVTFKDDAEVFLGGKEVDAKYFGRGHTNGDALIYFPQLRTLHTGDLMAGASPLVDYNGGGSVIEWTKTLDEAMKLDFDTVIPGHGPVTNKAGLKAYRDNIAKMREQVSAMIHQGKTQADVAKFMETEYKWAPGSLQQQWSVPGFMTELR
jgi:cyclase